jgi:hypothetical protein
MPINEHYLLMRKKTVLLNALGVPLCTIVMYLNTSIFGTVSVPFITAVSVWEEDYTLLILKHEKLVFECDLLLLYAMSLVEGWSYESVDP